jgi:hypothetical protein
MDIKNVQENKEQKPIIVSIRLTIKDKEFIDKNSINISWLLRKAIDELRNEVANNG